MALQLDIVGKPQGLHELDQWIQPCTAGFESLAGTRVGGHDDAQPILLREAIQRFHQLCEVPIRIHVLLAMTTHHKILLLFQTQTGQHIGRVDLRQVMMNHLVHRAARLDHAVGRDPLAQQVLAGDIAVGQVDVRKMIDHLAVAFLRNALVEAAVARLHVEDGDLAPLGGDDGQARIGVAQHQQGIGFLAFEQRVDTGQNVADRLGHAAADRFEKMIGAAQLQFVEENLVQFVVVVLPRVNQHVIGIPVQLGQHARQANDLRPRSHHRHDFEFLLHDASTGSAKVSGSSGSKISFAQNRVTSSESPVLVM